MLRRLVAVYLMFSLLLLGMPMGEVRAQSGCHGDFNFTCTLFNICSRPARDDFLTETRRCATRYAEELVACTAANTDDPEGLRDCRALATIAWAACEALALADYKRRVGNCCLDYRPPDCTALDPNDSGFCFKWRVSCW